jgi:hypothetical protein
MKSINFMTSDDRKKEQICENNETNRSLWTSEVIKVSEADVL